jgi:hypothetical protein
MTTTNAALTEDEKHIYSRHQMKCLICGNGMIVLPWGAEVAEFDRCDIIADGKQFPIHRYCLPEQITERLAEF